MKRTFYTTITVLCCHLAQAQVPNGGFESWSGNVPDNWSAGNIAPLNYFPNTPSSDAHTGFLAARGEVLENPIFAGQVGAPLIQTYGGAPVTQDPVAVMGWYKFSPVQSTARFVVGCTVMDVNGQPTGSGALQIYDAASSYTQFSMPIDYTMGGTAAAASVTISFTIADTNALSAVGSWYVVDDVSLDGAQGIDDHQLPVLRAEDPFPAPFAHTVSVPIILGTSANVEATVLDLLGKTVGTIVNAPMAAGAHSLSWTPAGNVPSGVYFIRVAAPEGTLAKRVLFQR